MEPTNEDRITRLQHELERISKNYEEGLYAGMAPEFLAIKRIIAQKLSELKRQVAA